MGNDDLKAEINIQDFTKKKLLEIDDWRPASGFLKFRGQ